MLKIIHISKILLVKNKNSNNKIIFIMIMFYNAKIKHNLIIVCF